MDMYGHISPQEHCNRMHTCPGGGFHRGAHGRMARKNAHGPRTRKIRSIAVQSFECGALTRGSPGCGGATHTLHLIVGLNVSSMLYRCSHLST